MVVSRLRAETHIRGIIPPSTRSIAEIAAGSVNIGACDGCATPADPGACRRAARSALIASTMHRSSRQASRAAVMKAVAADLIREQRRVIPRWSASRTAIAYMMARGFPEGFAVL